VADLARRLESMGFELLATKGTAVRLEEAGIRVQTLKKVQEGHPNVLDYMIDGNLQLVINTPSGKGARTDEGRIRAAAVMNKIPIITTLTAVSGRGTLICTSTSSGAAHWDVMAYGATTTTALPLMTYPDTLVAPGTSWSNLGNGSYLNATQLYNTMNASNAGTSSYTIYLPSYTHLMNGGTYSTASPYRTGGTWSGSYTAPGLIGILGYTPPIGFTFFLHLHFRNCRVRNSLDRHGAGRQHMHPDQWRIRKMDR